MDQVHQCGMAWRRFLLQRLRTSGRRQGVQQRQRIPAYLFPPSGHPAVGRRHRLRRPQAPALFPHGVSGRRPDRADALHSRQRRRQRAEDKRPAQTRIAMGDHGADTGRKREHIRRGRRHPLYRDLMGRSPHTHHDSRHPQAPARALEGTRGRAGGRVGGHRRTLVRPFYLHL